MSAYSNLSQSHERFGFAATFQIRFGGMYPSVKTGICQPLNRMANKLQTVPNQQISEPGRSSFAVPQ